MEKGGKQLAIPKTTLKFNKILNTKNINSGK